MTPHEIQILFVVPCDCPPPPDIAALLIVNVVMVMIALAVTKGLRK